MLIPRPSGDEYRSRSSLARAFPVRAFSLTRPQPRKTHSIGRRGPLNLLTLRPILPGMANSLPSGFIIPALPVRASHEIKHDGYRLIERRRQVQAFN
jgi:ATP-dependent DNA ligase